MPSITENHARPLRAIFVAALVAVLVLSLTPQPSPPPLSTGWDKLDHLCAYAVLGLLGLASWPLRSTRVLVALLAYGGAIELLQGLVPYRDGSWADLVADALGLALAQWTTAVWLRSRTRPG